MNSILVILFLYLIKVFLFGKRKNQKIKLFFAELCNIANYDFLSAIKLNIKWMFLYKKIII
ncbi:hypothetical protein Riv7116_3829 [Rivularia sp. PCC 7116]|nr:hypothetical protein Riv7116_3829 [Rivularia sp. PCC 7116]